MISLMLNTGNKREAQILEMAFGQRGFDVVFFMPNYQNYVKMLQFMPDILIVEFPKMCADQLHFIKLIRNHKQTKSIPVIGYGGNVENAIKLGYLKMGVNEYLVRPLQFAKVLNIIDSSLRKVNKSLDSLNKPAPAHDREADIAALLSPETLPTKKIEIMSAHTQRFMAFPFTVAKVLKLAQDEKSGAGDLAKVIETDPVISANILKVSNTVFFASLNRRIASIKDAIVRIGFAETKRIVVSMSVMDLFDKEKRHAGFDREDFWYHSLGCAIIAERLARRIDGISSEEAFLAGLLHDFGIIILDEFFDEIFKRVLEKTADTGGLFIDIETAMLGINHNDVVKDLFAQWKLPGQITDAVSMQYDYHTFENKLDSPAKKIALSVGVANVLAKTMCLGRECDQFVRPAPNWIFKLLKMPRGFGRNFMEDVYRDMELYRKFLGLEEREFTKNFDGIDKSEDKKIGFVNLSADIFSPAISYLQKQGIEVTQVSSVEKLSSYDSQFDIIITAASAESDPDTIDRFCGMVKRGGKPQGDAPPQLSPQLALVDESSALPRDAKLHEVSFMPKSFDLRKLEQNIMEMLMGKTVAFASYELKKEDAAAAAAATVAQAQTNTETAS